LYNKDTIQDLINQELKILQADLTAKIATIYAKFAELFYLIAQSREVGLIVRASPTLETVDHVF